MKTVFRSMLVCGLLPMCVADGLRAAELTVLPEADYTAGETFLQKGFAESCEIFRLWPGDGTREDDPFKGTESKKKWLERVAAPSMIVSKPEKPDGRAVMLFPGGAYRFLAAGHEGVDVAKWLNEQGITVFLVKYRCPTRGGKPPHWAALQDAQRAIRLVRKNAERFGIKSDKIGVMGFSAGGHLSALTCHQYSTPSYDAIDEADAVSAAPNFAILIYPAYLWKKNQLDPLVKTSHANALPTYMTIAGDDRGFVKGNLAYADHMWEQKAPITFHLYEKGGHGNGLKGYPWVKTAEEWLTTIK